jgi:hypothetical protein
LQEWFQLGRAPPATVRALGSTFYIRRVAARQCDGELRKFAQLRFDVDGPPMLLDNDIVARRQAEPGSFSSGLGGEERIEHLGLHRVCNASPVVTDANLNSVVEGFGRDGEPGHILRVAAIRTLGVCGMEAVGNEVQQDAIEFLRIDVDLANR